MEPSKGHKQTRDSGHPILVVGCGVGRLQAHRRFTLTTPSTYFRASTRENFPIGLGSGCISRPLLDMEAPFTGKEKSRTGRSNYRAAFFRILTWSHPLKSASLSWTSRRRKHPSRPTRTQAKTSNGIIFTRFVKSACASAKPS